MLLGCAQGMYSDPFLFEHIKLITKEIPTACTVHKEAENPEEVLAGEGSPGGLYRAAL